MLDTNICIYSINERPVSIANKLAIEFACSCISSITLAELYFGAMKSVNPKKTIKEIEDFVSRITVLSYEDRATSYYGEIRHELSIKGLLIGSNDLLIASHALSEQITLVTNNTNEFKRIPQLIIENWI